MEPITRYELYMAAAAGEYSGELPDPVTRVDDYLKKIAENGGSVSPAAINTAIADYINNHDSDFVNEQELSDSIGTIQDFINFIGVKR